MKRTERILTKMDGYQTITWLDQSDFSGRVTKIFGLNGYGNSVEEIPIPDDFIVCDFCNKEIELFPVPVFTGHALCPECYKNLKAKT